MMNTLTLLVCMVILFYTTESLQRERGSGFGAIYYATPLRTAAMLAGKALANAVLGAGDRAGLLPRLRDPARRAGQGAARPAAVRGRLGAAARADVPRLDRVRHAIYAATSNRYATYAIGLGAMIA